MTSHYLNQCLVIVKFQWNFNQNTKLLIHENVCESVICEMGAILSRKLTKLELQNLSQLYNWRFLYVARYHLHNFYSVNTLRPRQNGQHFADDIFKRIFFNENVWIFIKISLKYVPKGPINKIPALFQKTIYFLVGPCHSLGPMGPDPYGCQSTENVSHHCCFSFIGNFKMCPQDEGGE